MSNNTTLFEVDNPNTITPFEVKSHSNVNISKNPKQITGHAQPSRPTITDQMRRRDHDCRKTQKRRHYIGSETPFETYYTSYGDILDVPDDTKIKIIPSGKLLFKSDTSTTWSDEYPLDKYQKIYFEPRYKFVWFFNRRTKVSTEVFMKSLPPPQPISPFSPFIHELIIEAKPPSVEFVENEDDMKVPIYCEMCMEDISHMLTGMPCAGCRRAARVSPRY